jgi:PAS domain S-box-containing protein
VADLGKLLESALDAIPEGTALAGMDGKVAFWNSAAGSITGWRAGEIVGRGVREILDAIVVGGVSHWIALSSAGKAIEHGCMVKIRHKLGVELPVASRTLELRDEFGNRFGTGVLFHPIEKIDALASGEPSSDLKSGESRMELEDRLARLHENFCDGDAPLGLLWVVVDQALRLRRSHGARACEAMLESVEKTLASGLKPAEEIGRWSDQDFLILSHERSVVALAAHAQWLAGLARTTDFRWWGDRVSLTVSIGAAQALKDESLCTLLERAETAVLASIHAGGNHTTAARGNR